MYVGDKVGASVIRTFPYLTYCVLKKSINLM